MKICKFCCHENCCCKCRKDRLITYKFYELVSLVRFTKTASTRLMRDILDYNKFMNPYVVRIDRKEIRK